MPAPIPAPPAARPRLVSLDALRGFDMIWILGADAVMHALAKVWPVAPVQALASQFDHKPWAGFAFYDLIFPLFVFIGGVSLVFAVPRLVERHGRGGAARRILARAAVLFLLGIFYNGGLSAAWPGVRVYGVLQRIALCYAAAGLMFCFFRPRTLAAVGVALLAGYWALLTFVPIRDVQLDRKTVATLFAPAAVAPSATLASTPLPAPPIARVRELFENTTTRVTGRYEPGLNLANHLDFQYPIGKLIYTYWDPEGLLSTLPAIATCLLGVFAGLLLRRPDRTDAQKLAWLLAAGVAALTLGSLWGLQFPVVKRIWTSSFVLVAGGWSLLLLGAFYYVVDVRQWRGWCQPFVWIGMNPITLYLATGVVNFSRIAQRLAGGDVKNSFDTALGAGGGDLVLELVALGAVVVLARFLYRREIFLRV